MEFIELDHTDATESEKIRQLLFDAYSIEAALIGAADFPPLRRSAANICEARSTFFGCLYEGKLIALAEIEKEQARQVNIASFVVHPSYFRRGIGSQLLHYLLELLGNIRITVSTAGKNGPAIALYEKHGFQISEIWAIEEFQLDMVTMFRGECV